MPLTRIKTTAIDHVFLSEFLGTVASESAMLALVGGIGDYAVRSDLNNDSFIITQNDGSSIGDWQKISNTSTALLKSENLSDLPDAATARSSLGLGTAASNATTDFLQVTNNLSDLNNAATARNNLGLGTAATTNSTAYATAAQGTTADSALQPANIGSTVQAYDADLNTLAGLAKTDGNFIVGNGTSWVAESGSTARNSLGLGTAATTNSTAYATAAQGTKADTALQPANNLSDLNNAATARTNLGLGEVATLDVAGGAQDFVATGAISAGQIVGLRSDGTVEVIAEGTATQTGSVGTTSAYSTNSSGAYTAGAYITSVKKIIVFYRDTENNNYLTARVGSISDDTIIFNTSVVLDSNAVGNDIRAIYASNLNKVIVSFKSGLNTNIYILLLSVTSYDVITIDKTETAVSSVNGYRGSDIEYDPTNSRIFLSYSYDSGVYCRTATISGTTFTWGSLVQASSSIGTYINVVFDSSQNKFVIFYKVHSAATSYAIVANITGNTITFPVSAYSIIPADSDWITAKYDTNTNKILLIFFQVGSGNRAKIISVSGNNLTFTSSILIENDNLTWLNLSFNSDTGYFVIIYNKATIIYYRTAKITGASLDQLTLGTIISTGITVDPIEDSFYLADYQRSIIFYNYTTAVLIKTAGDYPSTNADSWIGIASQNISNGGTGTVTILSGVNENQTGLTPGASYYVNYDGTLTSTENSGPLLGTYGKIGRALSSTKLLITEGNA